MPEPTPNRPQMTPDQTFGVRVSRIAKQQCERLLGTERGQQAAQRITMAVLGAMQSARNPRSFYETTDLSLANCIALSAQTGLLPGGPMPSVYLVPQAPRKGEPPELQWRITHRGISVLAYRSGFAIRAVPVESEDFLRVSLGEVIEHTGSADRWPETFEDLQGVAVVVRDLARGVDVIRAWVPRVVIERRRQVARDDSVWAIWSIEMAMKTAIKYVMARGSIPIDSPELTAALEADADPVRESVPVVSTTARPSGRGAREALGLPDYGEPEDIQAEVAEVDKLARRREPIPVQAEVQPEPARAEPPASTPPAESPAEPPTEPSPGNGQEQGRVRGDAAALKRQAASAEARLPGEVVARIRAAHDVPEGELLSWRGRPARVQGYLEALEALIAAGSTQPAPAPRGPDPDIVAPSQPRAVGPLAEILRIEGLLPVAVTRAIHSEVGLMPGARMTGAGTLSRAS